LIYDFIVLLGAVCVIVIFGVGFLPVKLLGEVAGGIWADMESAFWHEYAKRKKAQRRKRRN